MLTRNLFEIVFFSCLLLWGAAIAAETGKNNAQTIVSKVQGQVELLDPEHDLIAWHSAKAKESLAEGGVIATGASPSYAEVTLPDHTFLRVASNSFVQISPKGHQVYLKKGGIVFSHPKNSSPYKLLTRKHVVIPSGTVKLSTGPHSDECLDLEKGASKIVNRVDAQHELGQAFPVY